MPDKNAPMSRGKMMMRKQPLARRSVKNRWSGAFGGLLLGVTWSIAALAADPEAFKVRTTGDLVALCEADANSPNYVAAVHFCHGFASGAYQYYESIALASPGEKFVCPVDPPPTRSEAIAGFLSWIHANPKFMGAPPVDSLFRYLGGRYPCSK